MWWGGGWMSTRSGQNRRVLRSAFGTPSYPPTPLNNILYARNRRRVFGPNRSGRSASVGRVEIARVTIRTLRTRHNAYRVVQTVETGQFAREAKPRERHAYKRDRRRNRAIGVSSFGQNPLRVRLGPVTLVRLAIRISAFPSTSR